MPDLIFERDLRFEFSDLERRRPLVRPPAPPPRAPGAHQSDILHYIAVEKVHLMKPGEPLEEDIPEEVAEGIMWEEFYFSIASDTDWQPGEAVRDGIAVNCDGVGEVLITA